MITHTAIWAAIDGIAERYKLSPSGLARSAGLDATTFNKSKRFTASGRERWPSTESIAKVLEATGANFDEFVNLMVATYPDREGFGVSIPLIDMDLAAGPDFLDKDGLPLKADWDEINFPEFRHEHMFAVEVIEDDYEPVYWAGDILVISPQTEIRRGDRVVVKYCDGAVKAQQLVRKSLKRIEVAPINNHSEVIAINTRDVEWMSRIVWVRQ